MKIISKKNIRFILFNKPVILLFLLPFAAGFVLYYFKPHFSVCLFMNLTDLPCPACGLTRSFEELSHFHFIESLNYNLNIIIAAPLFLFLILIKCLPFRIKIELYIFFSRHLEKINQIILILFIFFLISGFIRIFDRFFHFANFKEISPEVSIFKIFINIFLTDLK